MLPKKTVEIIGVEAVPGRTFFLPAPCPPQRVVEFAIGYLARTFPDWNGEFVFESGFSYVPRKKARRGDNGAVFASGYGCEACIVICGGQRTLTLIVQTCRAGEVWEDLPWWKKTPFKATRHDILHALTKTP